jgi:hypothetical protein
MSGTAVEIVDKAVAVMIGMLDGGIAAGTAG